MGSRRDRGEGSIYRSGDRWRVRVRYTRAEDAKPNQGLLQKTYRTKREALEELTHLKAEAERLETMAPQAIRREEQTLAEYLEQWHQSRVDNRRIQPTTARNEAICVDRITNGLAAPEGKRLPGLGHLKLGKLTVYTIDAWFDRLAAYWRDEPDGHIEMRRRIFAALRKALNDAKLGNRNPMIGADAPRASADTQARVHVRSFSEDELREILRAADEHENLPFSSLIWLLALTGVRIGEALGLIWENVSLDRERASIVIDGTLYEANGPPTRGPTKTKKSREIGLPATLADRLRRLRMKRGPLSRGGDFVFGTGLGTPMRQSNITRRLWHPLLDSVELERVGFHRLRHTHASLLISEGRPVTEVSARLGHKDVRTTLMVYAHALPDSDLETTAAIDGWLAKSSSRSS